MSKSLLYHAFGIQGYRSRRTDYEGGCVIFHLEQDRSTYRCPCCGSSDVFSRGSMKREFRHVPIGGKPVFLALAIPRISCRRCGIVRQVKVTFVAGRRSDTRGFERYALSLLQSMTIRDVARHLGVSWDVIKDLQKRHLKRRWGKPKLRDLRQIAIDEISIGKGHQYLTVVLDLESGRVVFIGDGKGADSLSPFWKRLHCSWAKIEAVAIDMSPAYAQAVRENLPQAVLVYDHFHIIKLFNDKLSDLRRELYREAKDQLQKDVLKGTRWLLLKKPDNLDKTRQEPRRLKDALKLNQPLAAAYYLKEDLRQLWEHPDKATAELFLDIWIREAEWSGIRMLQRFARTLQIHRAGILAWYDYPISTGPLEGTNNKIKTIKRQAYGYRDHEFFKLKIFAIHEAKYALVG